MGSEILSLELMTKALRKAKIDLYKFKKYKNSPLIISVDGKIVEIPASELVIPDESEFDYLND